MLILAFRNLPRLLFNETFYMSDFKISNGCGLKENLYTQQKNVFCTRTIKYTYKKTKSIKEAFEEKKNCIKKVPAESGRHVE